MVNVVVVVVVVVVVSSLFLLVFPINITIGMYKAYLKRHQDVDFSTAHSNTLQCVSPDIARALFKHSSVPGCEHFLSHLEVKYLEQQYEIIATTIVAASCSLLMMAMDEDDDDDDDDEDDDDEP